MVYTDWLEGQGVVADTVQAAGLDDLEAEPVGVIGGDVEYKALWARIVFKDGYFLCMEVTGGDTGHVEVEIYGVSTICRVTTLKL